MTEDEMKARIAELEGDNEKLKNDKHTALGEKNKANAAAKAAQEAADQAAQEAAEKAGDIEAIKASLEKRYSAELKKRDDALEKLTGEVSSYKIDSVISAEIAKAGVHPAMTDLVTSYLKTGAKIENGEAMVNGVPLADHISGYFASDAAKMVIAAPANTGGGATGSTTAVSNHGFTRENIRTPAKEAEWMAMEKTNPTLFKQVAADTGRTDFL